MIEQGRLHLDDEVKALVPEVKFYNPWHDTHPIRVVHLLEHTTGWDSHPAEQKILKDDALSLKSILDMTPAEYLRRFRLEKAKLLLAEGKSVNYTAFEVGFSSQSYFGQCFKAQFDCTPTEYS